MGKHSHHHTDSMGIPNLKANDSRYTAKHLPTELHYKTI